MDSQIFRTRPDAIFPSSERSSHCQFYDSINMFVTLLPIAAHVRDNARNAIMLNDMEVDIIWRVELDKIL